MKKRAFTLTELLLVVVLVGTIAAIVWPQLAKMLETRRTNTVEKVMFAVRTEQETRCSLDKFYTTQMTDLTAVLGNLGDDYTYQLQNEGISAASTSKDYQLQMLSYHDGRVCCSGTYCRKLENNYPLCEDIRSTIKYDPNCVDNRGVCPLQTQMLSCQEEGYSAGYTGSVVRAVNEETCEYEEPVDTCVCSLRTKTLSCQEAGHPAGAVGSVVKTVNEQTCTYNEPTDTCVDPTPTGCNPREHTAGVTTREFDTYQVTDTWTFTNNYPKECWRHTQDKKSCADTAKLPVEEEACYPAAYPQQLCGKRTKGSHCGKDTGYEWQRDSQWGACQEVPGKCKVMCDPDGSKRAACTGEDGYSYTYNEQNCSCECTYGIVERQTIARVSNSTCEEQLGACQHSGILSPKCDTVDMRHAKKGSPDCYVCECGTFDGQANSTESVTVRAARYSCGFTRGAN